MSNLEFMHPRDQIVDIMGRIYYNGMTTTSGGNLSIKDADGNIWISPGGVDKGTLTRDDIICVKVDGSIEGKHKPSSEIPFHRDIYKLRPDVKAVLHAHPPTLVSFSVVGEVPDTSVYAAAKDICGEPGFAPCELPGSEALGRNASQCFEQGHNTILLENHGACCVGSTLLDAFKRFETLDFCARMILGAKKLGSPKTLSAADLELADAGHNGSFGTFDVEVRTSDEIEMRYQLAKLIRRAYRQHLFTSTFGSVAARVGKNAFLATPHGVDRANLQPEDLALVKDGKVEAGKTLSLATWFFKSVFDAQPEINSLFIANPPNMMAYAVSHEPFDPRVIPESYILLREVPTFNFGAIYNNTDDVVKKLSPRYPVIIVQNDCIISSGANPLQAFDRMEVAEYSAKATIAATVLGGMKPITDDQIKDLIKAFNLIP